MKLFKVVNDAKIDINSVCNLIIRVIEDPLLLCYNSKFKKQKLSFILNSDVASLPRCQSADLFLTFRCCSFNSSLQK